MTVCQAPFFSAPLAHRAACPALPADLGYAKLTAVREGNCIGLLPQPTGLIVAWARKIVRSVFGLFSSNRKG